MKESKITMHFEGDLGQIWRRHQEISSAERLPAFIATYH